PTTRWWPPLVSTPRCSCALWRHKTGEVRTAFVSELDTIRRRANGLSLTVAQRDRLRAAADRVLASARTNHLPDEDALEQVWRVVFR
ncbi:MAG: hypothetical protein M3442_17095, partial [Chloroflexota bacterium]|nr:hypothetical protein [Chloroflexota bacterium]